MRVKDVLTINTYGGSLLLAAQAAGFKLRGSYEDSGYGVETQRANFPDLDIRANTHLWPESPDLSSTVVIAHPPCSAFSPQTRGKKNRGTEADAFQCTRRVLRYAMDNEAAAVLVESVRGAMDGAWNVHAAYARNGYHLFRILQNAASFGVPQFRPRFWVVYVRQDLARSTWVVRHEPIFKVVGDVVRCVDPPLSTHDGSFRCQLRLFKEAGMDPRRIRRVLSGRGGEYGNFVAIYRRLYAPKVHPHRLIKRFDVPSFSSCVIRVLDPDQPVTAILGVNTWVYDGKQLGANDFKAIAGFPRSYKFPKPREAQAYLSRGIAPPVGAWLLQEVQRLLERPRHLCDASLPFYHTVHHGEVLNLNHEVDAAPWNNRRNSDVGPEEQEA